MGLSSLKDFSLAGGTALALRYGHRKSIDLDLFGSYLDVNLVKRELRDFFGDSVEFEAVPGEWAIFSFIENVKVDIMPHQRGMLGPVQVVDGIRLFSDEDIIAMKVKAVFGRGVRKDFWDMEMLLQHYSLEDVIGFYNRKFSEQQLAISVPQALIYFEDAESTPDPVDLSGKSWSEVKLSIQRVVSDYLL